MPNVMVFFSAAIIFANLLANTTPVVHQNVSLDCGGWFSGFVAHRTGILYGYGDVFGVYRSKDSGRTWSYLQRDFTIDDNQVNALAVASGNVDRVAFTSPSRLWISRTGGKTWTAALEDIDGYRVRGASAILFHPDSDDEMWLASRRHAKTGSLWRSLDGGTTWTKIGGATFDSERAVTLYVRPEFPNAIFVGTVGALFVSTDRGGSWTRVWNNGGAVNPFTKKPPEVRAVVRRADGVGYVATDVGGYRLTATDWTRAATYTMTKTLSWWDGWGPSNATVLADGRFISGGDGNGTGSPVDHQDMQRISADGGQTWAPLPLPLVTPPTPVWLRRSPVPAFADGGRDFVVQDPTRPARLFMTSGTAPVVSEDSGASWRFFPRTAGIGGVMTYGPVRFPRDHPRLALVPSSDMGVFGIVDGGTTGTAAFCSNAAVPKLFTVHDVMTSRDGRTLVTAGVEQGANRTMIVRSADRGATWTELDLSGSGLPRSSEGVTRSVMALDDPRDFIVLLGTGGEHSNPGVWRTRNGGASFVPATGLPAGLNTGMRYHPENAHLEADGVATDTRYLSIRGDRIYRSIDGGSSWAATANRPFGNDWVHDLSVDATSRGRIWVAGGYRGLASTSDGGDTWAGTPGFDGVDRVSVHGSTMAVWGRRPGDGWNKLYSSLDSGATWRELSGPGHRYAFLKGLTVDPAVRGRVWITGISVNVAGGPIRRKR